MRISKLGRFLTIGFLILFLMLKAFPLLAEEKFTVYFFYGKYCPHCAREEDFLDRLEEKYDFLEVRRFEATENYENSQLLKKAGQQLGVEISGVPFTVIHERTFTGYLNDETTGREIEEAVNHYHTEGCSDPLAELMAWEGMFKEEVQSETCEEESLEGLRVNLPFFGEIDTQNFSLPLLTIFIGGVDGFNPCAMWVLFFLISLLLGMKDRRKMWLLGGTFIFASGFVYFLFLSAWLQLFLFIGFIFWVRVLISVVAIGSGIYYMREYFINKEGACKAIDVEKKQKVMDRFREIVKEPRLIVALLGMVFLAFAVNLIELVCSAGLPAVYTQILTLAKVSTFKRYFYLLLYIFVFILDDLVVFVLAMKTLHAVGMSGKYSRWANLIGGVVIFILGLLLIFKPEWIMLG